MSWFRRKPSLENSIEAAVTVASNLYLHTIPGAKDAPAPLHFCLPDSRYRYLIFCLSSAVTAALVYDEKKDVRPETLIQGCLHFAEWTATQHARDYFDDSMISQDSVSNATAYFQDFLKQWSRWPELEKGGKNTETIELIATMIHTTESDRPPESSDLKRLGHLALEIDCRMPAMRGAFIELVNR
jgi:hypothetical protein